MEMDENRHKQNLIFYLTTRNLPKDLQPLKEFDGRFKKLA